MAGREINMREYAVKSESDLQVLLQKIMINSPELLTQAEKSAAIGELSDLFINLFHEAIETASDADDAERYPDPDCLRDKMQGDADWESQVGRV